MITKKETKRPVRKGRAFCHDINRQGASIAAAVICLVLTGFLVRHATAQKRSLSRPNIVVIMSDDHGVQAVSAYDPGLINTPNIDRIAKEGALLKNAFVTNSICGPSRATILTGKYSHVNGFMDNVGHFDGSQQTFPKVLRASGYRTAIVGKWHLGSTPTGFDYFNILPGQGNYFNPTFINMGKDTVYNGYVTNLTTDLALDWIDSNKGSPFLMMIHHKAPHRNQMPPLENLELFNDREFPFPGNFFDQYENRLALKRQKISMANDLEVDHDSKMYCEDCDRSIGKWKPRGYMREVRRLTPRERKIWHEAYQKEYEAYTHIKTHDELVKWQFQRYMEDYLRVVKSVDDNVGKVLDYLDRHGLTENTIVIYTSDQGVFLGEHGLYDKRFMYEESLRTPMMIRYPDGIQPSREVSEFVLNMDIGPTILDFAGLKVPEEMQGESMKELLRKGSVNRWRDKIYYHYYGKSYGLTAHYGIRTERYKLIHFYDPVDSWELYDLAKDPREMNNLAESQAHAPIRRQLEQELAALRRAYHDTSVVGATDGR